MKMKLTVTEDNILIKQKKEEVTQSGIILSNAVTNGSMEKFEGEVLATGPDCSKIKKGDNVVFGRRSAAIYPYYNHEFMIVRELYVFLKQSEYEGEELGSSDYVCEVER